MIRARYAGGLAHAECSRQRVDKENSEPEEHIKKSCQHVPQHAVAAGHTKVRWKWGRRRTTSWRRAVAARRRCPPPRLFAAESRAGLQGQPTGGN